MAEDYHVPVVRETAGASNFQTGNLRELHEFGSLGEGVEGRDGFDEASDGESVAHAAGSADKVEHAVFAAEGNGHANQRRNAGTIDLRNPVQIDDDFARAILKNGGQRSGELIAGIADGEPSMHVKNINVVLVMDVDFDGSVLSHGDEVVRDH